MAPILLTGSQRAGRPLPSQALAPPCFVPGDFREGLGRFPGLLLFALFHPGHAPHLLQPESDHP